jgi:hypothetical protein
MTNNNTSTLALSVFERSGVDYYVAFTVVNLGIQTGDCARCAEPANARAGYSRNEPTEDEQRDYAEVCLACLLPYIDSIAYLNAEIPIEVEVDRGATARPF